MTIVLVINKKIMTDYQYQLIKIYYEASPHSNKNLHDSQSQHKK